MPTPEETYREPSIFLTVWDEAWQSIRSPRRYVAWAFQPFKRSFAYLVLMCAVASIVSSIYFLSHVTPYMDEAAVWARTNIPAVRLENAQLSIENERTYTFSDNDRFYVRIDASDRLDDVAIDAFYENGIIVAKDGVLIREEGETEKTTFEEIGIRSASFDGPGIATWINTLRRFAPVIIPIAIFIYLVLAKFLLTGFYSVLFLIFSGFRFNLEHIWSMALYAQTPAMLASYILFVFFPGIPFISTLVFLVYLSLAVARYHQFLEFRNNLKQ